jgi:hypothetical protein
MRQLLLALTLVLIAGCSVIPVAGIPVTLPAAGDLGPHAVVVADHAGIVSAAAPGGNPAPGEANIVDGPGPGFAAVPGHPDQLLVTWLGGECDDRTILTIDPDADRYRVHVEPQSSAMGCSAVGVIRTVLLTLNQAIAPDRFESG